ncbi:hypothetical protein F5050DRAFT_1759800 [Lentinula boryana]|uniref:Uncharacterized protein n=1 Tax=Lentinula boryana TaxID=40481 RepID=A0ABQ8QD62_9AGAR|nr:hypothetical protein F5050DRAFT_1759800 [Lentinula boryana]
MVAEKARDSIAYLLRLLSANYFHVLYSGLAFFVLQLPVSYAKIFPRLGRTCEITLTLLWLLWLMSTVHVQIFFEREVKSTLNGVWHYTQHIDRC